MDTSVDTSVLTLATPRAARALEVIDDIRQLDTSRTTDAAFRAGVRQALAERLAVFTGPLAWRHGRLRADATPAEAAGMICGILAWNPGPATAVLAELAQAAAEITVSPFTDRELDSAEALALDAEPGSRACERDGTVTAGPVTAARIRLLALPGRIPADAWTRICAGEPAGETLVRYGLSRSRRRARFDRDGATVDASAVLTLAGLPVAVAAEHVTAQMCAYVAKLARTGRR
jgi:hypothetical protein